MVVNIDTMRLRILRKGAPGWTGEGGCSSQRRSAPKNLTAA